MKKSTIITIVALAKYKSTIITIVAFAVGIAVLAAGFILLTDNQISADFKSLFTTTTTAPTTTTTTTQPARPTYDAMDLYNTDMSQYVLLGDYKGLTIETDQITITDEEIDSQIDFLLAIDGEYTKVREGQILEGVIFSFDFTGYLLKDDGTKDKAFDGGAGTDQLAYIDGDVLYTLSSNGIGSFIDGFAQGMINANVGDTLDLDITFPTDYQATDLAGKKTIFEIKINYIADTLFTDGWVKEYTQDLYKTCEEYRAFVKETIEDTIKNSNITLLWETIIKNSVITIPEQQFNYVYYSYRYQLEDYASMFGMTYEDFMKSGYAAYLLGNNSIVSDESLVNYVKEGLTYELVMLAIIQTENITASDEEYSIMLETLVEQMGKSEEEVLKVYSEEYIRQQLVLWKKLKLRIQML